MTPIEQNLLLYDDLAPAEQEDVRRFVDENPEWAPVLTQVRALHRLLRAGHEDATPDAAALADYVLAQALDGAQTAEQRERLARVEAMLAADPALERQAHAMLKTLEQVVATSEDPLAHFERLSGRRLEEPPIAEATVARVLPWQPLRFALAAGVALVALYAALALSSRLAQPERAVLADLGGLPNAYEGLRLRSDAPADRTSDRYARALDVLEAARSSTLGLFPHYDAAALDIAAAQFREVVDTSGPGSWEGTEALYALGTIRLYQGQDEEALWALQAVVAMDGPHASEARRLLDYLQHEAMERREE